MQMKYKNALRSLMKISVFDWLALIVFLSIFVVIALTFLRTGKSVYVTLRVSQSYSLTRPNGVWNEAPRWYLESIKPGLAETDLFGRPIIEVVDLTYFPNNYVDQTAYVVLRMNTTYDRKSGRHTFNGVPVLIGSQQELRIKGVEITGIVYSLNESEPTVETKKFMVVGELETEGNDTDYYPGQFKIEGIRNFLVEQIRDGITQRDNKGNTIFLSRSIDISPAYLKYFSVSGNLMQNLDQTRKKVVITAELTAEKVNDAYYFKREEPLFVGGKLYLSSGPAELILTITKVSEL